MAKNEEKVSVSDLTEAMKPALQTDAVLKWNGIEIAVKRMIPFKEVLRLTGSVIKTVFDGENGLFVPEALDYALRVAVLEHYTNIRLPQNAEKLYEVAVGTDLYDRVCENVNAAQLKTIIAAVYGRVSYIKRANIEIAHKQIRDTDAALSALIDNLEGLFGGVSSEDLRAVVGAVANGGISEEKLVKAIMEEKKQDA